MRRLVSTALLATFLLGAAACAQTGETPTAATTSKALDKAASCAAVKQDLDQITLKGAEVLATALKATTDPSLEAKAVADIKTMFADMKTMADKHMATALDPEVKAAMTEFQAQVKARQTALDAAGQDIEKVMDSMDDPAFGAAGDKLQALCP